MRDLGIVTNEGDALENDGPGDFDVKDRKTQRVLKGQFFVTQEFIRQMNPHDFTGQILRRLRGQTKNVGTKGGQFFLVIPK